MSLSDSCHSALDSLQDAFVHYCDWDYDIKYLNHVINAMYELASFTVVHDAPIGAQTNQIVDSIDKSVLLYILQVSSEKSKSVIPLLGKISKINKRLAESIDSLSNKMLHKENFFEMIIDPTIFNMLNELKMIKDS